MVKSDKWIYSYLLISLMIFAFITDDKSYMVQNILVPYINYSYLLMHLVITSIVVLILIFASKNKIVFDLICVFLLARIATSLIPIMYIDSARETMGRVTVPIITLLAYFIGRQYKGEISRIVKINMLFVVILSLQTIYTVNTMVVPYELIYAQYVKIPLASSNLIAAYITPCILLTLNGYYGKWYIKLSVIIVSLVAIILSTSTGAILILAIMLIVYLVFLNNKLNKKLKVISVIGIMLFVVLFLCSNESSLSVLTHGRSDLFLSDLKTFTNHIFIGNGMVYKDRGSGTHNILMDLLVQNGFVGFILYSIPLVIVLKKVVVSSNNKEYLSLALFLIAAFSHSLIETSYFNYSNDMIFWFMTGIAMSKAQSSSTPRQHMYEKSDCQI